MPSNNTTAITQDRLKEFLHYDPETGLFTWTADKASHVRSGDIAGNVTPTGYISIGVDSLNYRAHRLAFLYVDGEMPTRDVDHIDGNRTNNAFKNLRKCSRATNMRNSSLRKDNKSGVVGVCWSEQCQKWRANIFINKRQTDLGMYESLIDAVAARLRASRKHGYHPNHGKTNQRRGNI